MEITIGPKWNNAHLNNVAGDDHLGIKYVAILIADYLQSGITSITPRARYWSFYTWVLYDFINTQNERSLKEFKAYLKKQEWYYILANIGYESENGGGVNQLIGVTKGFEEWNKGNELLDCVTDYFKNSFGGYAVYRNVMKLTGVTAEADSDNGVEIDRITAKGKELAIVFEDSIKNTEYYKKWRHSTDPVPRSVLKEYGEVAGLNQLKKGAKDLKILRDIFVPTSSPFRNEQLRSQSMNYYLYIIKNLNNKRMSFKDWRIAMYDSFSKKGDYCMSLPASYSLVSKGWELYQGRQYFTYSLETVWSYLLRILSSHTLSKSKLLGFVFKQLEESNININDKVDILWKSLPLSTEDRETYINEMGKQGGTVLEYIYKPLLLMVDVLLRFKDRADFNNEIIDLYKLGDRDHVSLKVWEEDFQNYENSTLGELLEFVICRYILDQHQKVALNKILTTGNETYHFVEDDGKLSFIAEDNAVFNTFRVEQGISILADLGMLERSDKQWKVI